MPRPRKTPAEVSAARSAASLSGWSKLGETQRAERLKPAVAARTTGQTAKEARENFAAIEHEADLDRELF